MSRFCVAVRPTPVLNRPDFKTVFGSMTLPLDEKGLLRSVEMIALPGTKFTIHRELASHALEVTTKDYPNSTVYIDSRFVKFVDKTIPERSKILPDIDTMLTRLTNALGLPYVWGGNWSQGIPEIPILYEANKGNLHHPAQSLTGLDCSGLLYEATSGYTPRNTSELIKFGIEVPSIEKIQPLDIIVYPGHVIIILDQKTTIESRFGKGVVLTEISKRLAELSSTKFLLRRFLHRDAAR